MLEVGESARVPFPTQLPNLHVVSRCACGCGSIDFEADGLRRLEGGLRVEPDALWVTDVWDSRESHEASLTAPSVQAAIAKGRPLIAGFSNRVETVPLGGHGLGSHSGPAD